MEKIDELKHPPIIGKTYLVPCIISDPIKVQSRTEYLIFDSQEMWMDEDPNTRTIPIIEKIQITPIINHPHNDRENGQDYVHYHKDYRFQTPEMWNYYIVNSIGPDIRILFREKQNFRYLNLKCIRRTHGGITPVKMISKSKLKHQCIYKGKCPHRGMDLSQVVPIKGSITCPLHGLKFDSTTKKLINQ